ncbi:MAG: sugar ABC transporter substrate-binding protein [Chloroflexota bacterium]
MNRKFFSLTIIMTFILSIAGVANAQDVTIRYALWDTNQLPAYEECAAVFEEANPGIDIVIEQLGWDDYWTAITTGFVTGDTPDVFTNHLAKYPEFLVLEQIVDIQPLVERDGVATDIYLDGLADLWTRDGGRYGLPKDWDTVAVVYNAEMLEAAGVEASELSELTWNFDDGGSFEEMVARLSIDANGNNGLSEDFDASDVVQYGFLYDSSGGFSGQTQWSAFAGSTGWHFTDGEVWAEEYFYADERFINTVDWYFSLVEKGFAPPLSDVQGLGQLAMFQSQQGALGLDGSWMIGSYVVSDFEVGFARLPEGPEGRASMFNGLADSIWTGTENLEESWEWVKFLGSADCQQIVGESGVVFPAVPEAAEVSLNVRLDNGIDVSAFTDQAFEEGGTFLFPITDFGGEIATIMQETTDAIALGEMDAATALTEANEEVNSLFE